MSGLGRPFDLLLTFKEAPDGVPHLYCQEDTQALGLRTQPSVGETGYSNPPKGEAGLQVLRASTTLWSASSSEGKPEPSSHSEEWRGGGSEKVSLLHKIPLCTPSHPSIICTLPPPPEMERTLLPRHPLSLWESLPHRGPASPAQPWSTQHLCPQLGAGMGGYDHDPTLALLQAGTPSYLPCPHQRPRPLPAPRSPCLLTWPPPNWILSPGRYDCIWAEIRLYPLPTMWTPQHISR